ncbi:MAG: exodeoxyribonuclease VII large subunit [Calditrichaeota bacterium]|nr:MAG: exodeoxyribonuclease VII large subunit [Calditrichota bacterium]
MDSFVYTVSRLTREIKELLEQSFPRLWVEGEISNFKQHTSGHIYFTLKDEQAQIRCAMWRYRANTLLFRPEDGMKVVVEADLQVYERGGNYQLIVHQIQPAGKGELHVAFEQLKRKLHAEGLFDAAHKKPIPRYPERIGVVTSPTGAAIRDIVSVLRRRFPAVEIVLYPVRVQGEGAAEEIARAIEAFNAYGEVDVLIVGRGGGSLEDLWAFNEEVVARAIFASEIPIISAVGHEVDYSIADFVADRRAPTPSAAAEIAVRNRLEVKGELNYYREKLPRLLLNRIDGYRKRLENLRTGYGFRRPLDVVYQHRQRLDELQRSLARMCIHRIQLHRSRIANLQHQLQALNPHTILQRGYSICYRDGQIVRDVGQLRLSDVVDVKLARGEFSAEVKHLGATDDQKDEV